ncbi:hypothetical protein WJX82_002388 [Trebouxia sp. C0006]
MTLTQLVLPQGGKISHRHGKKFGACGFEAWGRDLPEGDYAIKEPVTGLKMDHLAFSELWMPMGAHALSNS